MNDDEQHYISWGKVVIPYNNDDKDNAGHDLSEKESKEGHGHGQEQGQGQDRVEHDNDGENQRRRDSDIVLSGPESVGNSGYM